MERSGITYSRIAEWRLAAQWAGYRYEEFVKLDGEEQSAVVATFRLHNQVEAVLSREQARQARRAARRI